MKKAPRNPGNRSRTSVTNIPKADIEAHISQGRFNVIVDGFRKKHEDSIASLGVGSGGRKAWKYVDHADVSRLAAELIEQYPNDLADYEEGWMAMCVIYHAWNKERNSSYKRIKTLRNTPTVGSPPLGLSDTPGDLLTCSSGTSGNASTAAVGNPPNDTPGDHPPFTTCSPGTSGNIESSARSFRPWED